MLKSINFQDLRHKISSAIDNRVRIITAGLGIDELRAVLRGDPPTEKPNPRFKVHTTSFLFHIRPRYYQKGSTILSHTFRLGFMTVFFFTVELVTGVILMIYYVPTPSGAYASVLEIMSEVPFGNLMRDLHRLGAEATVIFTVLHLLRTYFTGSYKKERSFTWFTGVILLGITLFLSFFGYLLPWDQLAYWAVTIGTSMAEAAPLFGTEVNLLLRGAQDIGAGGLLRAYLLHVILLPLLAMLVLSIHYYKVAREHGISLPARYEEGDVSPEVKKETKRRVDYLPDLFSHEIYLTVLGLFLLLLATIFFYGGAPLENIANPLQTPLDTKAPWYFWWLQGMLKLGDKSLMGIVLPTLLVILLFAVPYIDRNPYRSFVKRPVAVSIGVFAVLVLIALSYMGLPQYGIETPAATRIIQDLSPEEGEGPLQSVPYDQLQQGFYIVNETPTDNLCPEMDFGCPKFEEFFALYTERVNQVIESGDLINADAVLVVENWQEDLKKATARIAWDDAKTGDRKTYERHIYVHRNSYTE
ncbi:MAG: cytochrome b N-terminal domain-containing protein [Anaerolineales bacterium]|nr:cytochrome b N-terminal domain-containing protein [Anaerolineales bacterium]